MKEPLKEKGIETLREWVSNKWFYLADNKQLNQTKETLLQKLTSTIISRHKRVELGTFWNTRDKLHVKTTVISPVPTDTKV